MPQITNSKGHDYDMPPSIISCLVHRSTWALWCPACPREIAVDVIRLLEHHDPYDRVNMDRAKCKVCGGRLKQSGGYQLGALQFTGHMPKLITSDGSSFYSRKFKMLDYR